MELKERSDQLIREHLENIMNHGEEMSRHASILADLATDALLGDKKIFTVGNGPCGAIAQILTTAMIDHFELERPGFPAINLSNDHSLISQYAKNNHFNDSAPRQLRVLGHSGDLLLAYSIDGECANLVQVIQTAHEKEMTVAIISGPDNSPITMKANEGDFVISLGERKKSRVLEFQLLFTHILLDLIDCKLFGAPTA